jgi:hypothetical protein
MLTNSLVWSEVFTFEMDQYDIAAINARMGA